MTEHAMSVGRARSSAPEPATLGVRLDAMGAWTRQLIERTAKLRAQLRGT